MFLVALEAAPSVANNLLHLWGVFGKVVAKYLKDYKKNVVRTVDPQFPRKSSIYILTLTLTERKGE